MRRILKKPDAYLSSEVDGEVILVHGDSGAFFALKDVGLSIWNLLDDESELAPICARLESEYDVAAEDCSRAVERFASQLVDAGFAEFA